MTYKFDEFENSDDDFLFLFWSFLWFSFCDVCNFMYILSRQIDYTSVLWYAGFCINYSLCTCIRYYGATLSEQVLGKALKTIPLPREKYVVSTKCGRYVDGFDFSADRVTRSVDESLKRLNLDYIDILQCHDIEFGSLDQVSAYFNLFLNM